MKRALLFFSLLCVFVSVSLLAQATVTLSPSSYNFGSTPVGTGTAWETFTLSNSGSSAVSISNVTVSGPFVVSSNCGSSVAANGSCPIYVYFAPTASGAASGTLTVTDSGKYPQTSALSGTGGSGGSCTTTPSAPTGLAASGTTSSGTNLSWTADTPPTNCTISSYTVLQNGTSIGTATGTTFAVTGLTASTSYSFTVEATDANGTSAASSAVNVTTLANSCTTKPSAPTGLAASGTTSSGTNLSWTADTAPANCTISSYTILQNGTSIGTRNRHIVRRERPCGFDLLQLHRGSNGRSRYFASELGRECDDARQAAAGHAPRRGVRLQVYTQGMTASVGGENYVANFWTQNQNPATNSGGAGSGEPWTATGACSTCSSAPAVPTGLAASGTTQSSTNLAWNAVTPPAGCSVSYKVLQSGA